MLLDFAKKFQWEQPGFSQCLPTWSNQLSIFPDSRNLNGWPSRSWRSGGLLVAAHPMEVTMSKLDQLSEIIDRPFTRRSFTKGVGLTAAGIAGATMLGGMASKALAQSTSNSPSTSQITDTDILNFALNLEYLEAEFYAVATYGATLVQLGVISQSDTTGPATGGHMVPNFGKSPFAFVATALRVDEIDHVKFLRAALGSSAVKKPAINLNALGYGFASPSDFLKLSRQFEDVGVSAYAGAAPLISNKTYLEAAARILATEAEHSGSVRFACVYWGVNSPAVDSSDVPPSSSHPFCVDSMPLAIAHTTSQVLNIVYAGHQGGGGFFPQGMNGNIR